MKILKITCLALYALYTASNAAAAETAPPAMPGGYFGMLLCQSDEMHNEEKFVDAVLKNFGKLNAPINPQDIASIYKKDQDKQKTDLIKKVFGADYNGDGKVSAEEVSKYEKIKQREYDMAPKRNDGVKINVDSIDTRVARTMKYDTNKDGFIEYKELLAAGGFTANTTMNDEPQKQALSQQYADKKEEAKEKLTADARNAFAMVDLNKDHKHSAHECAEFANWTKLMKGER